MSFNDALLVFAKEARDLAEKFNLQASTRGNDSATSGLIVARGQEILLARIYLEYGDPVDVVPPQQEKGMQVLRRTEYERKNNTPFGDTTYYVLYFGNMSGQPSIIRVYE